MITKFAATERMFLRIMIQEELMFCQRQVSTEMEKLYLLYIQIVKTSSLTHKKKVKNYDIFLRLITDRTLENFVNL